MRDRINIDKKRQKEIREIKDNGYLKFDNNKDVFMFALATGFDCYNGSELEGKEAYFLYKDLENIESDKAIIYSLVEPSLECLEEITDKEKVLNKAEGMADKGFTILLEEMSKVSQEVYLLQMEKKLDKLYKDCQKKNLFEI